jgi:hypothetical protein
LDRKVSEAQQDQWDHKDLLVIRDLWVQWVYKVSKEKKVQPDSLGIKETEAQLAHLVTREKKVTRD